MNAKNTQSHRISAKNARKYIAKSVIQWNTVNSAMSPHVKAVAALTIVLVVTRTFVDPVGMGMNLLSILDMEAQVQVILASLFENVTK